MGTAFRGGQVLGFVLVGLAILNIMIIILVFKACWYNEYLNEALAAGMPIDNCPAGPHAGMLKAQEQIWAFFDTQVLGQWTAGYLGYNKADKTVDAAVYNASSHYYSSTSATVAAASDCTGDHSHFDKVTKSCTTWAQEDLCDLWTATTTTLKHSFSYTADKSVDEILFKGGYKEGSQMPNCLDFTWVAASGQYTVTPKTWSDAVADYKIMGYSAKPRETSDWSQTGAPNDLLKAITLARGEVFDDSFPNVPSATFNNLPRSSWIWSDEDQLGCMEAYNDAFYTYKQRICVLTRRMFELVAGYGLGGSSVTLFGRVGGGIYTKAADVGADLVGKTLKDLKEDDPSNPGTIADNVGDNVGDIAGMGADLFGSLAESTCAALVVSSTSFDLINAPDALYFPLMITAAGILASFVSVLCVHVSTVEVENVQNVLKAQIGLSTILMTACVVPVVYSLPETFEFATEGDDGRIVKTLLVGRWTAYICIVFGLWSGMVIGFTTEYFTSNAYGPTQYLAKACENGPAPNIIQGLALGYNSCIVPILALTATIGYSFSQAGMYGIGLSALGMLGSLPVALTIDGYGPIADNAGGIAEMSLLPSTIRDKTDALDAAGNTTAAVGKGFAIGSACLVGLALFGAFITRTRGSSVDILRPVQFCGLLVGAMLPYWFTALTMKAVGDAAYQMMDFIQNDYDKGQEQKRNG